MKRNPEAGPPYGPIERAPTDDDLDELCDLHRDSLRESVAATYGWDDNDQGQRFQAAWESRKSQRLLVAGEPIIAAWHVERREAEHEHFLTFVALARAYQNRKIGTWIVARFVEDAFRASADATLPFLKSNPRAKKLNWIRRSEHGGAQRQGVVIQYFCGGFRRRQTT